MDVKEILESKHIDIKYSAKDYIIKCMSPEHVDNNPSCHVDKLSGIYHCWVCGDAGNIYSKFNLEVPNLLSRKTKRLLMNINKLMWQKQMEMPLDSSLHTTEFRGISGATYKHFKAFTTDELKMEGRLVIPITDIEDNVKLFLGRFMYSKLDPKYFIYPPHAELTMFPENPAIIHNSIILVEGVFDMLNLYDKGLTNAVSCGGISMGLVKKRDKRAINIEKLRMYAYQGVRKFYVMYDGDDPGRKAAKGLLSYAEEAFNIEIIDLEDGVDPGSLTQAEVTKLKGKLYG